MWRYLNLQYRDFLFTIQTQHCSVLVKQLDALLWLPWFLYTWWQAILTHRVVIQYMFTIDGVNRMTFGDVCFIDKCHGCQSTAFRQVTGIKIDIALQENWLTYQRCTTYGWCPCCTRNYCVTGKQRLTQLKTKPDKNMAEHIYSNDVVSSLPDIHSDNIYRRG